MNKKSMAIEISKHPLIKKIVENKLASTKDVARLIAEEILRESEEEEAETVVDEPEAEDDGGGSPSFEKYLNAFKEVMQEHYKQAMKLNTVEEQIDYLNFEKVRQKFIEGWEEYSKTFKIDSTIPERGILYLARLKLRLNTDVEKLKQELEKQTDGDGDEGETEEPETDGDGEDTGDKTPKEETTTVKTNLQDQDFGPLKKAATKFINEFYEQEFLFQQGEMVKDIMTILIRITKKEDRMAAVRRIKKEESETETITEEETPKEKKDITSVQNALSSLVRIIKRSKKELKEFHEKSEQAKYGADRVKKQLLKSLQSTQNIIAELIQRLKKFVNKKDELAEGIEDEMLEMFQNIEKVYDDVAPRLGFIKTASENSQEVRTELNKQAGEIIEQLHSISHYFPNVNPFKSKDLPKESKEMFEEYELAISALLPFVRAILNELGRDTPVSGVIDDSIGGLERFSGHIQSIFGVESDIPDIAVDTEAPAATEGPTTSDVEAGKEPISDREAEELKVATIRDYKEFYEDTVLKLLAGRGEVGPLDEGIEADIKMLESSKKFIEKLIKKHQKNDGLKEKEKKNLKFALNRFKIVYETLTGQEKDYGKVVDTKFTDVIAGMRSQQIYDAIKEEQVQMQAVVIRLIPEDKARAVVKLFSNNLKGADFLILTAKIASLSEKPIEAGIITDLQESFLETAKEQPEMTYTDPTFVNRVLVNFAAEASKKDYEQLADVLKNEKELSNVLGENYHEVFPLLGAKISGMIKGDVTPEETKEESEKEIEKEVSEKKQEEVKGLISNMIDKLKSFLKLSKDGNQEGEEEEEAEEEDEEEGEEVEKTPKQYLEDFQQFIFKKIFNVSEALQEASRITSETSELKTAFLKKLHKYLMKIDQYKTWIKTQKALAPSRLWKALEGLWDEWLESIEEDEGEADAIEEEVFQAYRKNFFGRTKLSGKVIKDIFSPENFESIRGQETEEEEEFEEEQDDEGEDNPDPTEEPNEEEGKKKAEDFLDQLKTKIKDDTISFRKSADLLEKIEELGYAVEFDIEKIKPKVKDKYANKYIYSISTNSTDYAKLEKPPKNKLDGIVVRQGDIGDIIEKQEEPETRVFDSGRRFIVDTLILKKLQAPEQNIEEQIANKLKPLVKEILRKQK